MSDDFDDGDDGEFEIDFSPYSNVIEFKQFLDKEDAIDPETRKLFDIEIKYTDGDSDSIQCAYLVSNPMTQMFSCFVPLDGFDDGRCRMTQMISIPQIRTLMIEAVADEETGA